MRPNSPARSYDTALRLRMQSCKEFRRQSLPLGRQRACCASTCLRCHCQKSRSEPLLLSRRDVLELKFLLAAGAGMQRPYYAASHLITLHRDPKLQLLQLSFTNRERLAR